jgi:hypothetical protein
MEGMRVTLDMSLNMQANGFGGGAYTYKSEIMAKEFPGCKAGEQIIEQPRFLDLDLSGYTFNPPPKQK